MSPNKAMKPRSSSPNPKKKQLRFSETSTLIMTTRKTRSQLNASWYNRGDIREFKRQVRTSSAAMAGSHDAKVMKLLGYAVQQGQLDMATNEISQPRVQQIEDIRGLEHLLSLEVCRVLIQSRKVTIARVLEEQRRQRDMACGRVNYDATAAVSFEGSKFAAVWRQRIAALDT